MAGSFARALPSVDQLLRHPALADREAAVPRALLLEALREVLDEARRAALETSAAPPSSDVLVEQAWSRVQAALRPPLRRVLNATGVVVHTNLGRAPLSRAALEAIALVAQGYSNLEYDLAAGARGSRHTLVSGLIRRVVGAQDALVVNNNAAALVLALGALAAGREVIISRGELVEIGGGFRIPDIMRQSGARLVEVGTTNRTYAEDFERAIGEQTALLLRVHASNFRLTGFVHAPGMEELAALARRRELVLLHDLGSGALLDTARFGLLHEPTPMESLQQGADLVCFSGDKLLGGPQAGILAGRADLIARLRRHPLARAIRPDKMTLAALAATLRHYLLGEAEREIPIWRMIAATPEVLARRARVLADGLAGLPADVGLIQGASAIGGGSLPGETLPTTLVALSWRRGTAGELAARLRQAEPAVVARVEHEQVLLDPRTVLPEEDPLLLATLRERLAMGEA